jgi:hypothetical protein
MRLRADGLAPLALALLAGCASTSESERVVLLETGSYACGAAPDLGCGLALDPVLRELDALEGVERSRVSWDGLTFRIALASGADPARVAAEASAVLGDGVARVQSAGPRQSPAPQRWLSSEETVELSRFEAACIAAGFARDVATEVELDPAQRRRLEVALRAELELAFERAHAAGGGVHRLWDEVSAAHGGVFERLAFLGDELRADVLAALDRKLEE